MGSLRKPTSFLSFVTLILLSSCSLPLVVSAISRAEEGGIILIPRFPYYHATVWLFGVLFVLFIYIFASIFVLWFINLQNTNSCNRIIIVYAAQSNDFPIIIWLFWGPKWCLSWNSCAFMKQFLWKEHDFSSTN